uniref:Non-specific serine/threonine protein kinase n=1 Tax=Heterorhabditis bacteriophora TaxID=37862 RepID=A0A1I7WQS5_HETBA
MADCSIMDMCRDYRFPVAFENKCEDEVAASEILNLSKEKEKIFELESLLSKQTINEENSGLVNIVCFNYPRYVLYISFCTKSKVYEFIGTDLFTLWIFFYQDMLLSNASAIHSLPLLCLCQFLLYHLRNSTGGHKIDEEKEAAIILRIQSTVEAELPSSESEEAVLFFLDHLSSDIIEERRAASRALAMLFVVYFTYILYDSSTKGDATHRVSIYLSDLVPRSNDLVCVLLLRFYVKYMDIASNHPDSWSSDIQGAEQYIVNINTKKLLCRTTEELDESREMLMQAIRASMLCATDQRIVKVALEGISGLAALHLLCSFGLTTYSASQLLAVIDDLPLHDIDGKIARAARPFIIAYRSRGAKGGEKFLHNLQTLNSSNPVKLEATAEDITLVTMPMTENIQLELSSEIMTKQFLKSITTSSTMFILPPNVLRSCLADESMAMNGIDYLEGNLKFFLDHPDAFQTLLIVLDACAEKFPTVLTRLSSLAARVLKSASTHPSVEGFLRKFAPTVTRKFEKKREVLTKNMSADDILDTLNKQVTVSQTYRSKLLNSYLMMRPEVIEKCSDSSQLDRQLVSIFSGRNGVETLVAQIPLRSCTETIGKVFSRLLSVFNPKLNPRTVCEFISNCANEAFCKALGTSQLKIMATYIAELVTKDSTQITNATKLISRMVRSSYMFEIIRMKIRY